MTEHGFHDASCDLTQIDAWWAVDDYNLALSPEAAGWAILDLDGAEVGEASLAYLEAEHGPIPDTYEVRTRSGGRHLYFEGSLPPTVSRLGKKIDTRGVGSYVLVPPSVVEGQPYTVSRDIDIAPLPTWVLPALAKRDLAQKQTAEIEWDTPVNVSRAVAKIKGFGPVRQGDGADTRTFTLAAFMRDLGITPDTALELMLEHYDCQPQDDRFEPFLRRKIESAYKGNAQNDPGAWAVTASPTDVFGAALDKLPKHEEGRPELSPWHIWTLAELLALPVPEWLIPEMIQEQAEGVLFGPSGVGKTFIALHLALTVSRDRPVLFITGEGKRGIGGRVNAWHLAHQLEPDPSRFGVVANMPWFSDPAAVVDMIAKTKSFKPALLILDTVANAMKGMDESSAKDMGLFTAGMRTIARSYGAAVLAIHHTGKDASKGMRGSSALFPDMDVVMEVKAEERSNTAELWVQKQKDAAKRKAPWTFEAKNFAGSLVYLPTDAATHEALTKGVATGIRPENVALKLGELLAVDEDSAVTSHVLAEQMLPPLDGETAEAREESKARLVKALQAEASGKLAYFAHGPSRALKWWKS